MLKFYNNIMIYIFEMQSYFFIFKFYKIKKLNYKYIYKYINIIISLYVKNLRIIISLFMAVFKINIREIIIRRQ